MIFKVCGPPKSYFFYESDPKASHWSANNIHAVATKGFNSAIQHPWFASFAMSPPRKRSSAQRTEAFNFQLMFVQSFSYVPNENDASSRSLYYARCVRWRNVSEDALAASKGCLAGRSCYSFIAAFLDAEGSNIYFQSQTTCEAV